MEYKYCGDVCAAGGGGLGAGDLEELSHRR